MRDREMFRKDRKRIGENQVIIAKLNRPLLAWSILRAQETFPLRNRFRIHLRRRRNHSARIELKHHTKAVELNASRLHVRQRLIPPPQQWPFAFLLLDQPMSAFG